MTLYEIVNIFKKIALDQPNIRTTSDGSVYDALNNNPSVKYDVFHISQTNHQEDFETDYYGLQLFYISRLEDSLEDNRLQIQSIGKEVLGNIIRTFCENFSIDYPTITYIPFTQKFNDLTAGQYCNVRLEVPKDLVCADDYVAEVIPGRSIKLQDVTVSITQNGLRVITPGPGYDGIGEIRIETDVPQSAAVLQDKEVEYTENGSYTIHPDAGYDGLSSVAVDVIVPQGQGYEEGYEDGVADQKAKLSAITITENGDYNRPDGYSGITVNVPSDYQDGYDDGVADQKAKMVATAITENGEYGRPDGYSAITVNVPAGDDRYEEGYNNGFEDGEAAQKAKLVPTAFTENGVYSAENGYSVVYVMVEQTGYTQQDLDDAYDRGYQDGLEACHSQPITATSITINVANTITDSGTATTTVNPASATTNLTYTSSDTTKATINGTTGKITVKANGSVTFCVRDSISNLQSCKTVNVVKTQPITAFTYTADTSTIPYSGASRTITYSTSGFNSSSIGFICPDGADYRKNGTTITVIFPYNYYGNQKSYTARLTGYTSDGTYIDTPINYTQAAYPTKGTFTVIYNVTSTSIPTRIMNYNCGTCGAQTSAIFSSATLNNGTVIPLTGDTTNGIRYTFPITGRVAVNYTLKGGVLGDTSFYNCPNLVEVRSMNGVKIIEHRTFEKCSNLTSITIPNTVVRIGGLDQGDVYRGGRTFAECTSLRNITLPTSITSLCTGTFDGCTALSAITIPANVQEINSWCFDNCSGLTSMTFNGDTLQTIPFLDGQALGPASYTFPFYVPANAVSLYKSKSSWTGYANRVQAIP